MVSYNPSRRRVGFFFFPRLASRLERLSIRNVAPSPRSRVSGGASERRGRLGMGALALKNVRKIFSFQHVEVEETPVPSGFPPISFAERIRAPD